MKRLSQKLTALWSTSIVKRFLKIIFTKPYGKHKDALKNKRFKRLHTKFSRNCQVWASILDPANWNNINWHSGCSWMRASVSCCDSILSLVLILFCFKLIVIQYHPLNKGKIVFKPRIKFNHNTTEGQTKMMPYTRKGNVTQSQCFPIPQSCFIHF